MSFPVPPAVAASASLDRNRPIPPVESADAASAFDHTIPTPAQRLRFIDLCFEAAAIAREAFPPIREEGDHGLPRIANPRFGPAYRFQRALMMRAEGLPVSLIGKLEGPRP